SVGRRNRQRVKWPDVGCIGRRRIINTRTRRFQSVAGKTHHIPEQTQKGSGSHMIDRADLPEKMIVGSEEWCSLPQLGIPAIKVRVDSGAKTSSLHAFNIRPFSRAGISFVSFEVHPLQGNRRTIVRCEAEVIDKRVVKSSSGVGEKRFVVKTLLGHREQQW